MRTLRGLWVVALVLCCFAGSSVYAHFGAVIPSDDIITQTDSKTIRIDVKFLHPMEGQYMDMERPERFAVFHNGRTVDFTGRLTADKAKGPEQKSEHTFWKLDYRIKSPGDYTFFVKPKPYWEPAEDTFIVHYVKVCVNAFGLEKGWDEPVGLEAEIVPLTRPYGLWVGNVFTGQVLFQGKPVPFCVVEVEYLNASPGSTTLLRPPSDPFVTQVVKTDQNGVFTYAMPKAGWWGFAALNEAPWKLKHDGKKKSVEIGAVYWVHTREIQ